MADPRDGSGPEFLPAAAVFETLEKGSVNDDVLDCLSDLVLQAIAAAADKGTQQ